MAIVVADSASAAADGAASVDVWYDELPAINDVVDAISAEAVLVHEDLETNIAFRFHRQYVNGNQPRGSSLVTATGTFRMPRILGGYIEPRAVTAVPDRGATLLRLWTATQAGFGVRAAVARALEVSPDQITVLSRDVGGGFGGKGMPYPEEILAALAARRFGRAVRWVANRSEDSQATAHGHGLVMELELAATPGGALVSLSGRVLMDCGAYVATLVSPDILVSHLLSGYRMPAMNVEVIGLYTNAVPTGFIRGGGRTAGNFAIERLIDRLAYAVGRDRAELRRINLVSPEEMPFDTGYPTASGSVVLDGGDYPRMLDDAMRLIRAEQTRHVDGRGPIGLGLSFYTESTGLGQGDTAKVAIDLTGQATVFAGISANGQGHETFLAQIAAERLEWPIEMIRVVVGDTSQSSPSIVTGGSRVAVEMGNAVALAAVAARDALRKRAAKRLEASTEDVVLSPDGGLVRGTPSSFVSLADILEGQELVEVATFDPGGKKAYSSGCHAALVAIDPSLGVITLLAYIIVHDSGRQVNPRIVDGQLHGGWLHGLGYALREQVEYASDGNIINPTFLDYDLATANEAWPPPLTVHFESSSSHNKEGFRGVGESGTIPVPAAIASAVEDAMLSAGIAVRLESLPITSEWVWSQLASSRLS